MKKYIRVVLPLLVVLSLLLAACGGGQQATQPPGGETGAEPTEGTGGQGGVGPTEPSGGETGGETGAVGSCTEAARDQSIEMWSPLTGPDGDEMTALANTFSSENEFGITVNHVAQPEYVQKLNAAAAANQLPAMTVVRVINVAELAERNVLKPFSDALMASFGDDVASDFPENVWNAGEYEGQRYSYPLDIHTLVMYYNRDLFEQAGVEPPGDTPMTREEFEAALTALSESGVMPIALGTNFQAGALFQTLIQQFGGALTDSEGRQVTFNDEAGVQSLEYMNQLKQQYSPEISGTGDPEVNVFKQGNAAIVFHGPWHISDLQRLDYVGFAPVPQMGDRYAVWAGSHQLGLTTDDPAQQAAAACWMDWLSRNSLEWAKAGQIPARTSVRTDPALAEVAPAIAAISEGAEEAIILPQVPELEGSLWGSGFEPAVNAVLMGEREDLQAALDEAAATSQQLVDENAERYE